MQRIKERMQDEEAETMKSIMLLEDFAVKRSREMRKRTRLRESCFNGRANEQCLFLMGLIQEREKLMV